MRLKWSKEEEVVKYRLRFKTDQYPASFFLIHHKKIFSIFPSPDGTSLTKLSLGGNNDVIFKLFLPRKSLESDISAGDENIEKLFYGVHS
jgi:hypothetical protein